MKTSILFNIPHKSRWRGNELASPRVSFAAWHNPLVSLSNLSHRLAYFTAFRRRVGYVTGGAFAKVHRVLPIAFAFLRRPKMSRP